VLRSASLVSAVARFLSGSRAEFEASCDRLIRSAASDPASSTASYGELRRTITFMSSRRSRPEREKPLLLGVLRGHPKPGRTCRNVIDVDETPIKITIADTVITAPLAPTQPHATSPLNCLLP
jgi:hypothetical protein